MNFSSDFLEKLILEAAGPLLTAIVGTLIIGVFVNWITEEAQNRRAASQLTDERIRAQNQLRLELIDQMTDAASRLYIGTQEFWRKKNVEKVSDDELATYRKELDHDYRTSRIKGEIIERRLVA